MLQKLKKIVITIVLCASVFCSPVLVSAAEPVNSEEQWTQVSLPEEEFVACLEDQGFIVTKLPQTRSSNASNYKIQKRMNYPNARAGTGTIDAYNTIFANYKTVQGFNYFIKIYEPGVELGSGSGNKYYFNKWGSAYNYINGQQGIEWSVSGQFYCSDSYGISLAYGWKGFSGSVGGTTSYNYYYPGVLDKQSFSWSLVG